MVTLPILKDVLETYPQNDPDPSEAKQETNPKDHDKTCTKDGVEDEGEIVTSEFGHQVQQAY